MTEHRLFHYPYGSFTDAQLPLLRVAALYFDKLVILDPVGASWDTIGADHIARDAVRQLKDASILETVTPAAVLAEYEQPIADAIRRDMADRDFLEQCEAQSRASGKQRWTLALSKVPQGVQRDQSGRRMLGDFARQVALHTAYTTDDYIEHIEALSSLPSNDRPMPSHLVGRAHRYSWSEEFARELEHHTIPDIARELEEAHKSRDAWLKSKRGWLALSAAGIAVGAVAAMLSVFAVPLTPVALATAGLGLASGAVIPGAEWLLDWRDEKRSVQENGLHDLLRT